VGSVKLDDFLWQNDWTSGQNVIGTNVIQHLCSVTLAIFRKNALFREILRNPEIFCQFQCI